MAWYYNPRSPSFRHEEKFVSVTTAKVLTTGDTIFTIGGSAPILITALFSLCTTACDGTASTLKWTADGTVGAATDFSAASASLASFAAGGIAVCALTALSTAVIITGTAGVVLGPTTTNGVLVPVGIITTTIATGPTTGKFIHFMRYKPFSDDTTVVPAF